jgi:hypothetical protein
MTYAAIALILLGFVIGMTFRLGVLISALALLLVVSLAVSFACGLGFLDAALAVMAVQTIVQASYFGGLLVRAALAGTLCERSLT